MRSVGQQISALRRQRGLSQRDLASAVGRSESWVSQVERDVQPVERLSVLKALADALGVDVADLRPDAPLPAVTGAPSEQPQDLDAVQIMLSGHPALSSVGAGEPAAVSAGELDSCERAVDHAKKLLDGSRFADLSAILVDLVPRLERLARSVAPQEAAHLHQLRTKAYRIMAASFAHRDEAAAAWVASDRAITAAEFAGGPLDVIAAQLSLAYIFIRLRRYAQAEHVLTENLSVLRPLLGGTDPEPEALSLAGALHLASATLYARKANRVGSHNALDRAEGLANKLGVNRNDFDTEFGPTNVLLHRVAVAIDLADAGEALEVASKIDPSALSLERRAHLLIDLARAHNQTRQAEEALAALIEADKLAPEMVRSHHHVRAVLVDLLAQAGRRPSAELRALADRAGV